MPNHKTRTDLPRPRVVGGYVRKSELDDFLGRHLPIPTQVVSNEEYAPLPQTPAQKRVERMILRQAEAGSARLGISRREFLRTSCGMAAAFVALNSVFGEMFAVEAAELWEAAAAPKKEYFVFDVQTHHVATGRVIPQGPLGTDYFLGLRGFGASRLSDTIKKPVELEDLYLASYVKEVFLDSETDVAVLTGIPALTEGDNPALEHSRKMGIKNVCLHKGLLAIVGILVTLSAFVMLYKSYQARGYLNYLGAQAKRGNLPEEYLRLDGWPKKRIKNWRRGVWLCPWLERAGDVLEPYLFLPGLMVSTWLSLMFGARVPLSREIAFGVAVLLAIFILSVFCIVWVGSQRGDEEERREEPARP